MYTMKLLAVSGFLALFVGSAYGGRCYVGANSMKLEMDCGDSSNKCVYSEANSIVGYVCYNQMKWSMYPGFDSRLGCQGQGSGPTPYKICICYGDLCNKDATTAAGTDLVPETWTTALATIENTATQAGLVPGSDGVECYVGTGTMKMLMKCGTSSDKCVWSKADTTIGYVCDSQMKWSTVPMFNPRMGCQESWVGGKQYKICICKGDRCNRDETSAGRTSGLTPHVHGATTSATALATVSNPITTTKAAGVECYVGAGSSKMLMNCGTTSQKCVWSKADTTIGYVCYNQMKWSTIPSFDPRMGCQESWVGGRQYKICICKGDRCNENAETALAGGSNPLHSFTIMTLLLTAIGAYLLQ